MAFTTNHNNVQRANLMDVGEYELIIISAGTAYTAGNTEYVKIESVVRNDVDQKYKNKHVFDSLWLSEKAMEFTERKINTVDKALEMPEATYESYDEWGAGIVGRAIRAKITHSKPQPGYDPREQVSTYMPTKNPAVMHAFAEELQRSGGVSTKNSGFTEVEDDKLPF